MKQKVPFRQRYRDSRRILAQAFAVLKQERDLWRFPLAGVAITFVFMVAPAAVLVPWMQEQGFEWVAQRPWLAPAMVFLLYPLMYPFAVVATMLNGAMAYCLHERMEGREGSRREGWQRAKANWGVLARFNAVAMVVTGLFVFIGMLLDRLRIIPYIGQITQVVGTWAWATATFFVIPIILVDEQRSATQAIRESVGVAKQHWGKSVAGMVTISLAVMVPFMVFMLLLMPVAMVISASNGFNMGMMFALFFVPLMFALVVVMTLTQAATTAYQVGLFRYARTGRTDGGFDEATLSDPWKPYQV